jgi:hypothetical protein
LPTTRTLSPVLSSKRTIPPSSTPYHHLKTRGSCPPNQHSTFSIVFYNQLIVFRTRQLAYPSSYWDPIGVHFASSIGALYRYPCFEQAIGLLSHSPSDLIEVQRTQRTKLDWSYPGSVPTNLTALPFYTLPCKVPLSLFIVFVPNLSLFFGTRLRNETKL